MTSCVIFVTLSVTTPVILSKLPFGIPGMSVQFGFRQRELVEPVEVRHVEGVRADAGGRLLELLAGDLAAGVGAA